MLLLWPGQAWAWQKPTSRAAAAAVVCVPLVVGSANNHQSNVALLSGGLENTSQFQYATGRASTARPTSMTM